MMDVEEDRGQFAPFTVRTGDIEVIVVHAGIDEAALKVECDAMMAALHARGIALMKFELGEVDRFRIRHVSPDEFMEPAPPAWPKNLVQPDGKGRTAQWKRERNRFRR